MINRSNFSIFQRLLVMMPFIRSSGLAVLVSRVAASIASPHSYCLVRGFLFLLAGTSFFVLTACAGGGSGSSSGGSSLRPLEVNLTFAPISGGFRIGNQSNFGDMVSLNIRATSRSGLVVEEPDINIDAFIDDSSHDFTGLADLDWKFQITGTLSDGGRQEVDIGFVWDENEADNARGGIRSGLDTDGDRRANSVDEDDDNDGLNDNDGREQQTNSGDVSCSLLVDCDGDNVMDLADIDDDGDGLIEVARAAELDAVRHALNGDGRRLSGNAALNTAGCGGAGGITECSGYELVADISLANYADDDGGKGWQPLGYDSDTSIGGCQGAAFNGTFEGNGWTISDLNINRSSEDCVGLFGQMAMNSEIRNLTLRAESVIGRNRVGGLVGDSSLAQIVSSSVVAAEVSGTGSSVGGLVGLGASARVYSSSVVASKISGTGSSVGALVGSGASARVHSSSIVAGEVRGATRVGGLVGSGEDSRIHSSSVVAGQVSGTGSVVGGLVGWTTRSAWIDSSSVVANKVSGGSNVGGLLGSLSANGQVAYSYVVSGSKTEIKMLAGLSSGKGAASYWDSDTSGFTSGGNLGAPQTTSELRTPTGYTDIYANWTADTIIFDDGSMIDVPLAVWCDRDNSGIIEDGEKIDDNLIWDFGESDEYPAIRCTPMDPDEWRDWWSLNATDQPELDRDRLDEALNPNRH